MQHIQNAMVVYANNYQFAKDQIIIQSQVQSRMLLWCKSGYGSVEINKKIFQLEKGEFLFLPWNRKMKYLPSAKDPFFVAGIHIIPDYKRNEPCHFTVAHTQKDSHTMEAYVKDKSIAGLEGTQAGNFKFSKELEHLSEYIILAFQRSTPEETEMRTLAKLVLESLIRYFNEPEKEATLSSSELGRILQFIDNHIDKPLSLIDLENFSELSSGGICGLFKRHLNTSPCQKIAELKMERAKHLLSAGRISVAEVGCKVGIEDPYYFSKRFKKICGISPLDYRKQSSFL